MERKIFIGGDAILEDLVGDVVSLLSLCIKRDKNNFFHLKLESLRRKREIRHLQEDFFGISKILDQ
jgi:hypothetical protein